VAASFKGNQVPPPSGYDEVAFSRDVIARWADVCHALIDDKGLLHPQMWHLGRMCEAHPEVAPEVFQFLEELLVRKDTICEIRNAVAISFLDWEDVQRLGFSERLPTNIAENYQRAVGTLSTKQVTPLTSVGGEEVVYEGSAHSCPRR
jgi:hypothetical protein